MAISIKTPEEIEKMRIAGRLAAEVLEMIEPFVKPGVSTGELDRICNDYIVNEQHAVSACLGYHGFPKSVCISINEVVCHGIPDDEKLLKDGWTVKTKDRSLSAQYEHTIVVTDNGCEIMTLRKDDTIPAILTHDE